MKTRIQALGAIKKEFPPRGNLIQIKEPARFFCSRHEVEVASAKVALDLRTDRPISNGAYGQLLRKGD